MLQNKVAVITGASSGLGRAIAIRYAKEGASLILADVNEEGGAHTLTLLPEGSGLMSQLLTAKQGGDASAYAAPPLPGQG